MTSVEKALRDFMVGEGVSSYEAELAARRCAREVTSYGVAGAAFGVGIGLLTSNHGALLMGVVTGAAGAGLALAQSPSCEEVRDAATRLAQLESFGTR